MMTRNRPTETREERARREYHSYTFRLVTVRTSAGPRGMVYVTRKGDLNRCYAVTDNGRCSCVDFQRHNGTVACKHVHAARLFLSGDVPEVGGSNGFDIEGEAARLAALETEEARHAQAVRDRELWD